MVGLTRSLGYVVRSEEQESLSASRIVRSYGLAVVTSPLPTIQTILDYTKYIRRIYPLFRAQRKLMLLQRRADTYVLLYM